MGCGLLMSIPSVFEVRTCWLFSVKLKKEISAYAEPHRIIVSNLKAAKEFSSDLLPEPDYTEYRTWPIGCSCKIGLYLVCMITERLAFRAGMDRLTRMKEGREIQVLYKERHPVCGKAELLSGFMKEPDRVKIEIMASKGDECFV